MFAKAALVALSFAAMVLGQQAGSVTAENHPKITVQQCSSGGSCTTQQREIVLDSNWRWLRNNKANQYNNCYTGNTWDSSLCSSPTTCAQNCALEGAEYQANYGITTSGNSLTLKFKTGTNVGSRVYLMDSATSYQMFNLNNQEFTFDVDMSQLPCGLNGALYFVQMDKDGGMSRFSGNKAGAKYGTGYCDAQCARDIKFINGEANVLDWAGASGDPNGGRGRYGTCCNEMDIWEANSMGTAYTPHVCGQGGGQVRCEGQGCASFEDRYNGICDKDGCDWNSFRMGDKNFIGRGKTVDTTKKMTVVTQFISSGGNLSEIKRFYVQNGRVIANAPSTFPSLSQYNSLTDQVCAAQKSLFGDVNDFADNGGMRAMGQGFQKGMVLAMSVWDDFEANMLWLDGEKYPLDKDPSQPGIARGECTLAQSTPEYVRANSPNAQVIFSNIKYGALNSTFSAK
ncbi:family 7 glycoside hydrolase [Pterulicium gracile]|uniref:Glucanase n=1 Tax=Pterulicium gracile TaxID=1884261 RepID=A0A5C3QMT6_9AGAR|nr:family 7 glycoside hydrolase [Pterula gracilis]